MIQRTIQFIYPATEHTRPWSLVNHLAVVLARRHNPDYNIRIWTNDINNDALRKTADAASAELIEIELIDRIGYMSIKQPQYIADVMRLDILHAHGGIYMDTDMLLLQPLEQHVQWAENANKLFMSWENEAETSICNALMIAPPRNEFLKAWLNKMPVALQSPTWAQGGVVLPAELAKDESLMDTRILTGHRFACPLDLTHPWLFDPTLREAAGLLSRRSTAIHVFETYWRDTVKHVDADWIDRTPCLFSDIFREAMGDRK